MSAPAPAPHASTWGITGASLLATLVAAGSLRQLIQGDGWWWAALLVGALAVTAAAAVRTVRQLRPVAPLAGVAVAALLVPLLWLPDTLTWGILPTERTLPALGEVLRAAVRQIYLDSPPATATPGLILMVAFGIAVLALLIDALVAELRLPWLAGLPLLLLAIVPARAVGIGDDLPGVTATVAAFLLLVWLDRRRDQSRPRASSAAALGAVAVAGALVLQSLVPTLIAPAPASAGPLRPVFTPGADPLVRLGDQLRRGADVTVLTYRTDADRPVYMRVVTIDDLTGDEWTPTTSEDDPENRQVRTFPAPPGLSDAVAREEVTTDISESYPQRTWVAAPYPATSVEGLVGDWAWEPESLTVQAVGRVRPVGEYTVHSLDPDPTVQQLRSAPSPDRDRLGRYLTVPDTAPAIIAETAREVTAEATTAYDQAIALQDWLRGRDFTYDEDTPQVADGDGDSMDVLAAFLEEKRGYCTHFASAMTVMARQLGIPARIGVGYQPGERRISEPGVFEVTSHDLHAWPELYFEGAGWVRFEPTPGRGDVPRFSTEETGATDGPSAAPTPSASTGARDDRTDQDVTASGGAAGGGPPIGGIALGAGVVLALLMPAGARILRRRRRLAALRAARVGPAWDEVQDTALDLGLVDSAVLTPRTLADRLEGGLRPSDRHRDALRRLLVLVERERFARPGTAAEGADPAEVQSLLAWLRSGSRRRDRARAALAPRSLFVRLAAAQRAPRAAEVPH
ncbi:DUF3488 and transglutaminase-like domain-containing protein [Naasia sp. SYSU D00057]|uniref:transglutaminase family protein n=1 Tax=Naasia sp. SYSU D00057 TaxID=2817380 RepID=UPI001B30B6F8|nr:DUF3488 and transglutaminase-like domain-containing protein [Naasia sp. SYSU D00057]